MVEPLGPRLKNEEPARAKRDRVKNLGGRRGIVIPGKGKMGMLERSAKI